MAATQRTWETSKLQRIAAGAAALVVTSLIVVAIDLLATYCAAGPLAVSAAQWAT